MLDSDASTAKTLTLVAIVLQLIFLAIGVLGTVALVAFLPSRVITTSGGSTTTISSTGFGLVFAIISAFFLVGIIWILLDYFLVYKRLAEENVKDAEVPSLVLGIVQLIIAGVIPGILLIIAYVKIRDSIERNLRQPKQNPTL